MASKAIAAGCGMFLVVLFIAVPLYALTAWIVVSAANLFIDPNYTFTFWQYVLIGWALAIVTGIFRRRG